MVLGSETVSCSEGLGVGMKGDDESVIVFTTVGTVVG